ncbi:MAG: VOC family protein [Ruminococcaceae bacterium]|nr:VOC family protein [Oscillospiraceae bacterium]
MVKGIEHVAIFSKDSKALSDWYKEMFDLKTVYDNGKGTYFLAFESGDMIEFCMTDILEDKKNEKTSGIRHFAFSVDVADFDAMVKKIKDSGAEVVTDAVTTAKGVSTFFFRDIDGNVSHLIARTEPLY